MRRFALISAMLLAAGCAAAPAIHTLKPDEGAARARRDLLAGRWYGEEATEEGGKRLQIVEWNLEGVLKIRFRTLERSGRSWDQTEVGLWGISGPVYFTIITGWLQDGQFMPADPGDASFYDAYEILELNDKIFRYRSFAFGDEYTLRRVEEGFTFPK